MQAESKTHQSDECWLEAEDPGQSGSNTDKSVQVQTETHQCKEDEADLPRWFGAGRQMPVCKQHDPGEARCQNLPVQAKSKACEAEKLRRETNQPVQEADCLPGRPGTGEPMPLRQRQKAHEDWCEQVPVRPQNQLALPKLAGMDTTASVPAVWFRNFGTGRGTAPPPTLPKVVSDYA